MNDVSGAANAAVQPFRFKTIAELYAAPAEEVSYSVTGLLPTGGLSVLAGKPKAGKTTFARQLAVAVAQGEPFLDRETESGTVLYVAIEEKQAEVIAHFRQLGLHDSDPVHVITGAVPKDKAVAMLEASLRSTPNVKLVIIDPIFRFVGVRDSSDYIQVTDALEPLLELSRKYGVHILTVHHMKKRETEDVMDGALGSTAITGTVDTYMALKVNAGGVRTLCSRQRYGTDMPETQLTWNPENRALSLGITSEEADILAAGETRNRIEDEVWRYVTDHPDCTQEAIFNAVCGKTTLKKRVFQICLDKGFFHQSGGGVKGNPYTYKASDFSNSNTTLKGNEIR
jgi:archaellum biogenesis ATPase FlaH